jgi:hypothetical protein
MRSDLVVLTPELLDRDLRIDSVSEPLHAQALIAEFAIERLIIPVLPWLSRIDMCRIDVRLQEPTQYCPGNELRSVVRSQILWAAVNADQLTSLLSTSMTRPERMLPATSIAKSTMSPV